MMAQLYEPYLQYKPVDNFDLSLNISEPAEPSPPPTRPQGICRPPLHHREHGGNGYVTNNNGMAVDQTFHTPSFGDEDFDLAPPLGGLHGHPGAQASASSAAPVSIPTASESPTPAAPPPHPPSTVSPDSHLECYGGRQSTTTSMLHMPPHHQTSPPQQQQHPQQSDMYMQPPPPPPPQHHHHPQHHPQHQQLMYDNYGNLVNVNQQQQHRPMHMNYGAQMQILGPSGQPQHMQMMGMPHHNMMQHQGPHQHAMQHQMAHCRPGSAGSGSPPTSNHTSSPGLETGSEDSDDCTQANQGEYKMMGGLKRPSPEPMEPAPMVVQHNMVMGPSKPLPGVKKPKVQKKKKKRDPNEPQKPVSAYALFFRDTQAAIKGQNPNASFGEVSKIVASMWDSLDADHKNIYKRKTENAKKEYLKALAAYRASLVSKAAADQSDNLYGNNNSLPQGVQQQQGHHMTQGGGGNGGLSPLQKKSPLLTSLMEVGGAMPTGPHFPPAGHVGHPPMSVPSQTNHMLAMMGLSGREGRGSQQGHQQTTGQEHQNNAPNNSQQSNSSPNGAGNSFSPNYQVNSGGGANSGGGNQGNYNPSPPSGNSSNPMQTCLRSGCNNPAVDSPDWDREYCSSECVVSHCRDVFTHWVSARQVAPPANTYASVK